MLRWATRNMLLIMLGGCAPSEADLFVDIRTDHVPTVDFTGVVVSVFDGAGLTGPMLRSEEYIARRSETPLASIRVAEFAALPHGALRVQVRLTVEGDTTVAEASATLDLQGSSVMTLLLPRTDASCSVAADCPLMSSCSSATCLRGLCFYEPGDSCAGGELCHPIAGCVPDCGGPCSATFDVGGWHACVSGSPGRLACWGSNVAGQLGDGGVDAAGRAALRPVVGLTGVLGASAGGGRHTCVVSGGGVLCWGDNRFGQLGDGIADHAGCEYTEFGSAYDCSASPVGPSPGLAANAVDVAAGSFHSCAQLEGGRVRCWGRNDSGELGDGSLSSSSISVEVDLAGVQSIAAGGRSSCAVVVGGGVQCWGALGGPRPVPVAGLPPASAVTVGTTHACALTLDAEVYCWGGNVAGQLGNGGQEDSPPSAVAIGLPVTEVSAGFAHTCAVAAERVLCWGSNGYDRLGDGVLDHGCTYGEPPTDCSLLPVEVFGLERAVGVALGHDHGCALLIGGDASCWGRDELGLLGTMRPSP